MSLSEQSTAILDFMSFPAILVLVRYLIEKEVLNVRF